MGLWGGMPRELAVLEGALDLAWNQGGLLGGGVSPEPRLKAKIGFFFFFGCTESLRLHVCFL